MTHYSISYWFQDDAGTTDRHASLLREIGRCPQAWTAMPGLALVATEETIAVLEARLYLDSALNAVKDGLVVVELAAAAATARGVIADLEGLRAILPGVSIA